MKEGYWYEQWVKDEATLYVWTQINQLIDVSFLCVCPLIDNKLRHNTVKVAVEITSRLDRRSRSSQSPGSLAIVWVMISYNSPDCLYTLLQILICDKKSSEKSMVFNIRNSRIWFLKFRLEKSRKATIDNWMASNVAKLEGSQQIFEGRRWTFEGPSISFLGPAL